MIKGMGRSIRDSVSHLTVSISDNFSYCKQVVGVSESKRSLKNLVSAIKVSIYLDMPLPKSQFHTKTGT